MVNSPIKLGIAIAATNATTAASHRRFNKVLRSVVFQLAQGPTAIKNKTGTMIGTNTALK
jgi:hypothetical protein